MTDRLADISARIHGIRQLGAVVNAMRGIAAARAQRARVQLAAVDSYAATIVAAIGRAQELVPSAPLQTRHGSTRPAVVLFCAEQGFAGAFSERVLDAARADLESSELFVIGTRGAATLAERGATASWTAAMPSHSAGIPKLADRVAEALYARIATGTIDQLEAVFTRWQPGHAAVVERRQMFPLEPTIVPHAAGLNPPLLDMAPGDLADELTVDYVHALLCEAALHGFVAENEARMEAMAAARNQVERQLSSLQARQRLVRQEEITAEVIELAAGETASADASD